MAISIIDNSFGDLPPLAINADISPLFLPQKNAASTLDRAKPVNSPRSLSRPVLTKPNAIANLVNFQLDMEITTNKLITSSGEDLKQDQEELKHIEEEKRAALEEELKSIQSKTTWSTLAKVATYILNVGSLMTGNYFLIAAGSIGLFNNLAHDTRLVDKIADYTFQSEETREKYIKGFDALSVMLQVGLSLPGSVFAWNQGFFSRITGTGALEKVSSIVSTAAVITGLFAEVKASAHQNEIAKLRSRIKELEGNLTMKKQDAIPQGTKRMVDATEYSGQEAADAGKAINSSYG